MEDVLSISLKLEQTECIRGESAYFNVVLKNVSRDPLADLPDFTPTNRAVTITAKGSRETRTARQERYGPYRHIEEEQTITLNPGQTLTMRGDLLSWVGELEAGKHQITATYRGEMIPAVSKPVELTVLPAVPVFASTPRYGAQSPAARFAAVWVHKQGNAGLLFYQHQNPLLPRVTLHCVRAVQQKAPAAAFAANVASASATAGHVLWRDEKERLQFTYVDTDKPRLGNAVEIKVPFKGEPLASPLSVSATKLLVAYADPKLQKVAVLEVGGGGDVKAHDLDLGKVKPLGPYSCFWEYGARLHFSWAAPGGREVQYARLPLDAPATGFATRAVHFSNNPIVWIDAYLDAEGAFRQAPYLEEMIPEEKRGEPVPAAAPGLMLWCVTETPTSLSCARVNTTNAQSEPGATFSMQDAEGLRVTNSVVTYRHDLALLLADANDRLYYASTVRGSLQPLAGIVGKEITHKEFPSLITASYAAREAWVYLRYVSDKRQIKYERVDPAEERDPVERQEGGPTTAVP